MGSAAVLAFCVRVLLCQLSPSDLANVGAEGSSLSECPSSPYRHGVVVFVVLSRSWADTSSSFPLRVIHPSCVAKDAGCCSAGLHLNQDEEM